MQQALAKATEIRLTNILFDADSLRSFLPKDEQDAGILFDFGHNVTKNLMRIDLKLTIDKEIIAQTEYHYLISDLDRFYTLDENEIAHFNGAFLSQLCGISYATLRGLLLAFTDKISNIILPIIDPVLLVNNFVRAE